MRILYVLRKFAKFSETFIAHEMAELIRRGHEVRVLTPVLLAEPPIHPVVREYRLLDRTRCIGADVGQRPDPELPDETRAQLRRLARNPPPAVTPEEELGRLSDLVAEARAFAPDHVHAHFATEGAHYAVALHRVLGLPFSFTAHGYDIYRKAPLDFAARAAGATHVITVSEANRRAIASLHGVPLERIHVIGCGVDLRYFRPGARPDPHLILAVARLEPIKRLDVLLAACARLRDRGVRFRCVVVGEGVERPRLDAQRRTLGLEDRVQLVGSLGQDAVREWLGRAAVVALTSELEGLPVSLMESAACGRPVVATAVGGVPELVDDGRTGLLVPAGDSAAVAAALERLLSQPALRDGLGCAARERAEARFGLDRQVGRLLELWSHGGPQPASWPDGRPRGRARATRPVSFRGRGTDRGVAA